MKDVAFAQPYFFLLLLLVPLMALWYWRKQRTRHVELRMSTLQSFAGAPRSWRTRLRHVLFVLRVLAIICIIAALARPQSISHGEKVTTEGIDIVLTMDISGSMLAEDFRPNRIEAAKTVAKDFIDGRQDDRLGLVVFAGEGFTQCPLTIDHVVLKNLLLELKSGMVEDGTAIGSGLATAVTRLKDSKAKSRVIILLTDGVNNRGSIDPLTAAGIAQTFGIRVYTVGVGTTGTAPYPFQTPFGIQYQKVPVEIDEEVLRKIAAQTGGKYFRATDNKKLTAIYKEIDQLEKTRIEVMEFRRYREEFYLSVFVAGGLLILEFFLSQTLFRTLL